MLALAAVTAVALVLRAHQYTAAPLFTDNADEIQFTWAGLNLILGGDAYTWSHYPGYAGYHTISAFGTTYPLVHHWMDHPPLFSVIMGGWVWLLGARDMLAITPGQVRVLPIAFSTMTVPLAHALARRFIGSMASLCGVALLATAPAAVLLGRQAEPESLQAVLLLVGLLLTLRLLEAPGRSWTGGALLACCAAAPLLKVSGVAIAGTCAVILVTEGQWLRAGLVTAAGAMGLVLYAVYGALVDWSLFVAIWGVQAGSRAGVMSGYEFVTAMAGIDRRLRDGWWILGWLGLALLAARGGRRRELFLVWPAVAYAATMLLLAGERQVALYGWYRLIVHPELYLAAGWLAWEAISRRSLVLLTALLVLGGATATNWWLGGPDRAFVPNPLGLFLMIAVVLGPAILALWRAGDPFYGRAAQAAAAVALAGMVVGNTVESAWLDRIFTRL